MAKQDQFYPVTEQEIKEVEKDLGFPLPEDLRVFYQAVGYGFLASSSGQFNRLMDPVSVRDFRLKTGDFAFYPDLDTFDELTRDKLMFFEANEVTLLSIGLRGAQAGKIFCDDVEIAGNLSEFLERMASDDRYYLDLPEEVE